VAGIAASGAFGSFVVNLGHNAFRWWWTARISFSFLKVVRLVP